VRAAVQAVMRTGESVTTEKAAIELDGKTRWIFVIVEPIPEGGAEAGLCVVAFQDAGPVVTRRNAKTPPGAPHPDVQALKLELQKTKTELRATIDELETSNEEMRSANEAHQSVNEELQSSNEELETAKEEMQSVNEELQTINAEMSGKNEALTRLNSDLKNCSTARRSRRSFLTTSCASRGLRRR